MSPIGKRVDSVPIVAHGTGSLIRWVSPVFVLFLTVFVAVIPSSIIIPMLPFIGQKYGATPFQISLLFTLMPMLVIVVAPIWGRLSDKFGRKPVFMFSLGASALTFIFFGLADSLTTMFIARALQGITGGNVSIAFAIVADTTTHENRARYLGYTSGAMAMAFAFGPLIGGLLMGSDLETFTHTTPSIVAAGLSAVATVIGVIFLKESRPVRHGSAASSPSRPPADSQPDQEPYVPPSQPVGTIGMILIILQFFLSGFVSGSDQFVFAFWAQGLHGWGPDDVSFGMAAFGCGYMLATIGLVGPLTKRFDDLGTYMIGSTINVIGLAILLLGQNAWVSFAGLMLAVVGIGVWSTVLSSVLTKVSPADKIGYMLGLSNGASMIGRVIGPLMAGALFLSISYTLPFLISLVLVLIVVANALRLIWNRRRFSNSRSV